MKNLNLDKPSVKHTFRHVDTVRDISVSTYVNYSVIDSFIHITDITIQSGTTTKRVDAENFRHFMLSHKKNLLDFDKELEPGDTAFSVLEGSVVYPYEDNDEGFTADLLYRGRVIGFVKNEGCGGLSEAVINDSYYESLFEEAIREMPEGISLNPVADYIDTLITIADHQAIDNKQRVDR